MEKINISSNDYQWHGMGYNNFNFCRNVSMKLSNWLLAIYNDMPHMSFEDKEKLADKMKQIVGIINEE